MAASYSFILLLLFLILEFLEGRLKNLGFQEGLRNVLLLLYLFWKSLGHEKSKQIVFVFSRLCICSVSSIS